MNSVGITIQRGTPGGSVLATDKVVFDTVVAGSSFGVPADITYNATTDEIEINKAGRYFINWWVATEDRKSVV